MNFTLARKHTTLRLDTKVDFKPSLLGPVFNSLVVSWFKADYQLFVLSPR